MKEVFSSSQVRIRQLQYPCFDPPIIPLSSSNENYHFLPSWQDDIHQQFWPCLIIVSAKNLCGSYWRLQLLVWYSEVLSHNSRSCFVFLGKHILHSQMMDCYSGRQCGSNETPLWYHRVHITSECVTIQLIEECHPHGKICIRLNLIAQLRAYPWVKCQYQAQGPLRGLKLQHVRTFAHNNPAWVKVIV